MTFPTEVKLVEVGPRDGLQNEKPFIPTDKKIELINRLSQTGLKTIETTSFVSPKWIPQFSDNTEVLSKITRNPTISYPVLIPNVQGMQDALKAKVETIAVFCAATETFSQKNTHCSIQESLSRIAAIAELAKAHSLPMRGYISCVLGCPYEGEVPIEKVATLAKELFALGCDEIALGDTIGVGTPHKALALIQTVSQYIPISKLAVHFHDTYGQALANIYACLEQGISIIDSAIGGLGGCPYATGASGNVATEDVLYLLNGLNIHTGVNLKALLEVTEFVIQITGHKTRSKVAEALLQPKA
jgi:hydroxymethylglutaryl-CoA lyase